MNFRVWLEDEQDRVSRWKNVGDEYRLPVVHKLIPPYRMQNIPYAGQKDVTVYRAVSAADPNEDIRPGDWVALTKAYAAKHLRQAETPGRILAKKVPAEDVAWAGTDENEWFYSPRTVTEGQHDNSFAPAMKNDPELNGLNRGLGDFKPVVTRKKSKMSKKVARLFGKREWVVPEKDKAPEGPKDLDYGACIFFSDGEKVLLLKRSPYAEKHPDVWGLPAGHAQEGETPLQTAKREAKEEVGRVEGQRIGMVGQRNKWITFFYKVKSPFEAKLNEEHTEFAWVRFEDLGDYHLHPFLKRQMDKFVAYVKSGGDGATVTEYPDGPKK